MEYQGKKEKRNVWHFQPPGVFMFRSFGQDLKGCGADTQTPKEAIFYGGTGAHVKVIMKAIFCSFKYRPKLVRFFLNFHLFCCCNQFNYPCLLFDNTWYRLSYSPSHWSPHTKDSLIAPLFHHSYMQLFYSDSNQSTQNKLYVTNWVVSLAYLWTG